MRSQITKPNRRTASKISCKALKIWTKKSGTRKKQTKPTQRSSGKTPGRAWKITFLRLECRRFSYLLPSHLVWTPALRNLECACSEAPLSPLVSLASDGKRTKRTIDERDRMAGLSATWTSITGAAKDRFLAEPPQPCTTARIWPRAHRSKRSCGRINDPYAIRNGLRLLSREKKQRASCNSCGPR